MARQIQGSQHDFSFGEIDVALKRSDDHPARKAGLRQMANARILNSGGLQNRSGRRALFPTTGQRIEQVTMSPGNQFKLVFGTGFLIILDSAGAVARNIGTTGSGGPLLWTDATLGSIVIAQLRLSIYITFPGMVPQVVAWDGVATWTIADFAEIINGNQKRTWFYRISPQGITLLPGARTGAGVSLVASAPVFKAGHVGTRMRYVNRQILITAVADSTHATVTIMEPIPGEQDMTFATDPTLSFRAGDVVFGSQSGSQGLVLAVNATTVGVQLISTNETTVTSPVFGQRVVSFITAETLIGPGGSQAIGSAGPIVNPSIGTVLWDEEIMNPLQGYPASCFVDQFRVGFCDFPTVPNGIGWSAINSPTDLYIGGPTVPSGAMFELAPEKVRVFYVVPGPESSEFVFCDHKIYYIPISPTNPLKPGSVGFQILSGDGSAQVQPRISQEAILYVNAGGNSVMAVIATGAFNRPFNTKNLSDYHAHLFNNIVAIAAPNADGTFNERYAYVLNGDGSIAVGKYTSDSLTTNAPVVGWGPWSGGASVKWISALNADVLFTSSYFGALICEILDDAQYLDAALFVNALPVTFTPPAGKGPLWWIPSQTVSLMDQGTRSMGTYDIDANGFIVPQNNGGENLALASLVAGQPWTTVIEPFAPDAQSGVDLGQRMKRRQISLLAAYVINSTGFEFATLFSALQTRTSPALGTVTGTRRVPAWNQDDDPTKPPPQRETVETWSPPGSSFDPRVAIIKDTPGPLLIAEIGMEVTI